MHKFPEQFAGIHILNNPVVLYQSKPENVTLSCEKRAAEQQASVHRCDYPGCNYEGKDVKSLSMHTVRCHKKESNDTVSVEYDTVSRSSVSSAKYLTEKETTAHRCDYFGCSFVGKNRKSLFVHKRRCHNRNITPCSDTVSVEPDSLSVGTMSTEKAVPKEKVTANKCDYPGCSFVGNKVQSVSVHKRKCHNEEKSVHECDYPGCNFIAKTVKSLSMHNTMCHKHRKSLASSTVNKQTVDLSQNLNELSSDNVTRESEIGSVVSHVVGKNAKPNVSGVVLSDVEPDDTCISVAQSVQSDDVKSIESDSSTRSVRSSLRIRNKDKGLTVAQSESNVSQIDKSDTETVQRRSVSSCDRFACDADGCDSLHETARGLSIHKRKRHSLTQHTNDAMSVGDDDVSSVKSGSTVDSTTSRLRRSVRIENKNERIDVPESESNVTGAETVGDSTTDTWQQRMATNTRRDILKTSFSAQIAQAEKKFLPKNKATAQTDPLYDKLKQYHDVLLKSLSNTTTEKLSSEVVDVILNPAVIDDCDRRFVWSAEDEKRLNELNKTCKSIKPRTEWTWGAADDSEQGQYNDKRMQLCITKECDFKIIECDLCESTGILIGNQTDSEICYDCMQLKRSTETIRGQKEKAWKEIKPKTKEFPKAADGRDLPHLQAGDKAVANYKMRKCKSAEVRK